MNTFQTNSLLLILLFLGNISYSQNLTFGGTINLGPSVVTSNEPADGTFRTKAAFSGNFGVFLEKKLGKNVYLGIEGLWVQMEGFEVDENIEWFEASFEESISIGYISEEYRFHTSYLGLPLYFRYEIGKLGIKGGIQSLFLITTSTHARSYGELYNEPHDSEGKAKPLELSSMDFGPKIGIDYNLIPNLRLRLDYYHGMSDIAIGRFDRERKNRQLSVGISYIFGKKEDVVVE